MKSPRIALAFPKANKSLIIHEDDIQRLNKIGHLSKNMPDKWDEEEVIRAIDGADAVITSWGSGRFTEKILDAAPNLRIIAHAAGTVKDLITDEVWERGIVVTSAAAANAVSVAQFTFAMMIFMLQEIPFYMELTRQGHWVTEEDLKKHPLQEPYRITVGVVSASHCGMKFIEMIRPIGVEILLYDPFVDDKMAVGLGAKKVGLDDLMRFSDVVSLHPPSVPSTRHMINKHNLCLMKDGAILLQTARGSVINEADLIAELQTGRIRAAIDVTDPEPPAADNPLRKLPNVVLTPHLAGSTGTARWRMGKYAVDEVENIFSGKPPNYPVTKEMLDITA